MINIIKNSLFFLFFSFSFHQKQSVDGVVAIVGNNILLKSEALQQAQLEALSLGIDPIKSPLSFEDLYESVLSSMIDQYVLLDLAEKDTNIVVSSDEVDLALEQQINDFVSRAGSEAALEEATGMSVRRLKDEYWGEIYNMLMIDRYRFSLIQGHEVSRKEVLDFFDKNKNILPVIPARFSFSFVERPVLPGLASDSLAYSSSLNIYNLLVSGVSFDSLASNYSDDLASAKNGGLLGYTKRGSLVKEFEEVAFSLDINEFSLPVKSAFGYHIIKLLDKRGEKIKTQHILTTIKPSSFDSLSVFLFLDSLVNFYKDPFLFDSVAVSGLYKKSTRSGMYDNIGFEDIPKDVYFVVEQKKDFGFSSIFKTQIGYGVLYKTSFDKERPLSKTRDWLLLHQYAQNNYISNVLQKTILKRGSQTFKKQN